MGVQARGRRTGRAATPKRRLVWRVVAALALLSLLVIWVVAFRPQSLGGPVQYAGVSGASMIPTLHDGDLAVAVRHASYEKGAIIVFHVPVGVPEAGLSVIHRIVGGDGTAGFVTEGDNNNVPDPWHPMARDVVGKVWIVVPGRVRWLIVVLAGVLLLLLVLAAWPGRRRRVPIEVPAGPNPAGVGERRQRVRGAGSPGPRLTVTDSPSGAPSADVAATQSPSITRAPGSVAPTTNITEESAPPVASQAVHSYWASSPRRGRGAAHAKRRFRSRRGRRRKP